MAHGTWFSNAGVREETPGDKTPTETSSIYAQVEIVLGEGLARELGEDLKGQPLGPGDTLTVGPRQCLVVGVMTGAETTFGSEIWAKRQKVGEMFGKEDTYTAIVLRAKSPEIAKELADRLSLDFKKAAVTAMTEPDYFAKMGD